jgi:putative effector of murein hydrolase
MIILHFLASVFWTTVTIVCYAIGLGLRKATNRHPVANPALIAIVLVAILVELTRTPYADYFGATWILTFLLAPATVALGIPLAQNFAHIRRNLRGVGLGLAAGSLSSMLTGVFLVKILGGSKELAMSMMPKAVTTPIAMSVAGHIGGRPALTAALAIMGGIVAAITLRAVLGIMRVTHEHAVGLAAGTAGSGIAGAHAAAMGDTQAAYAAIGIGLNGLLTALVAPALAALIR